VRRPRGIYVDKMKLGTIKSWNRRDRKCHPTGSRNGSEDDNIKQRRVECMGTPTNPDEDEVNGRNGGIAKKQRRSGMKEV